MNTVCGTVRKVSGPDVEVTVERRNACQGCGSMGICHGFVKTRMELTLPKPTDRVSIGDTVVIAIENTSLLKASATAFLIPLVAVLAGLLTANGLSLSVPLQAASALLAFGASLVIVRYMGKKIEQPHIIEVLHEE